jgi:hypothetical protein
VTPVTRKCPEKDLFGKWFGAWRMLFTMDPFMPLDSLSSGLARHVAFCEEMTATTSELINESNDTPALKCLLCRGESSGADDVQRLYCTHCAWFHEPVDEIRLNMLRHVSLFINKSDFQQVCRQYPEVALKVLAVVGRRLWPRRSGRSDDFRKCDTAPGASACWTLRKARVPRHSISRWPIRRSRRASERSGK